MRRHLPWISSIAAIAVIALVAVTAMVWGASSNTNAVREGSSQTSTTASIAGEAHQAKTVRIVLADLTPGEFTTFDPTSGTLSCLPGDQPVKVDPGDITVGEDGLVSVEYRGATLVQAIVANETSTADMRYFGVRAREGNQDGNVPDIMFDPDFTNDEKPEVVLCTIATKGPNT